MSKSEYIIPYTSLLKQLGLRVAVDDAPVELTRTQLDSLIRKLLVFVPVDEDWYRTKYPDVEEAINSGRVKSAKEHFVADGYFEGRLPAKIVVDERYYVSTYPDVAEGIDGGEINSAQEHFESHGFIEGRLPFEV